MASENQYGRTKYKRRNLRFRVLCKQMHLASVRLSAVYDQEYDF